MKPTFKPHPLSNRHRRIGRKVLQADRIARALVSADDMPNKSRWHMPSIRSKSFATMCAIVIGVSVLGYASSHMYRVNAAASQKVAAAKQQSETKVKMDAAAACRQKKAEQKADLIGKVTYDELYDNDECDK